MQSSTWNSSFELVCTIEFTDATTGNEINARKSWPLSDVTWLPAGTENSLCWAQIVKRMGDNGSYDVDVSNLDALTEDACELIKINRRELASDTRALGKQQDANSGVSTDAPDVDDERLRGSDTLSDWGIKFRSSDGSSDNIDVPVGNSR
ncbi:hypothetical protein Pmar_PMAR023467 [Perkinsus marinus ATCC 50983]|uniref:Uncharacterized protein n=1 Tax=Perkinsus marinus (strain ATCC 50983 / TXsc) TaxID=423536 RepID=C5KKM9_PERM5|nr:hypothetical protein Pmar_PMAR023467 [Perkinsus marinus ATCC 50983]EER15141.1 hypothetical protein Pmar_PMAR023467 [Perkinsus marinus ATCC 50983]|eukprot:XP_002783345.1 hypothetical protein Pmar_PMAR023467 [Perkinsus marinus ATCC 50983]